MDKTFVIRGLIGVATIVSIIGCGGDKKGSGGDRSESVNGAGNVYVVIESADVSLMNIKPLASTACSVQVDSTNYNGRCLTPLKVTGKIASVFGGYNLGQSAFGGTRLLDLGGGSEISTNENGQLTIDTFDLGTPITNSSSTGEDNISENTRYYNRIGMLVASMDVQVYIDNANVTNKYWTIRYPFMYNNFIEDDSEFTCDLQGRYPHLYASIQASGKLYEGVGSPDFHKLDILVCQKANAADVCANSDFRWIDATDGSLETTRPVDPVRFRGTHLKRIVATDCSLDGGVDMNLGGFGLVAATSNTFSLKKDIITHDPQTGEGLPEPVYEYTHNSTCTASSSTSGSCTGQESSERKVKVTVDLDVTNFMFAETATLDIDNDTEVDILMGLEDFSPKAFFRRNHFAKDGAIGESTTLNADITVELTSSAP